LLDGERRLLESHVKPLKEEKDPPRDSMPCDRGPVGMLIVL